MVAQRRREDNQLTVVEQGHHASEKTQTLVRTPIGSLRVPTWLSGSAIIFVIATIILVVIIQVQPFEREEESNCLAMLIFCTILWATEVSLDSRIANYRLSSRIPGNPSLCNEFLRPFPDCHTTTYPIYKRRRYQITSIGSD